MKRRHYGLLIGALVGVLSCGGGLYAAPYITLYQMYQAAERNDVQALATHVDFPALRDSVKANVRAMVVQETAQAENPLMGVLGSVIGSVAVDQIVDRIVTPASIAALLEGQQLQLGGKTDVKQLMQNAGSMEVTAQYQSLNQFAVRVQPKVGSGDPVTLLLSRDGFSWKVSGVQLPNSFVAAAKGLLAEKVTSDLHTAMPNLEGVGNLASKFLENFESFQSSPSDEAFESEQDRKNQDFGI